MTNLKVLIAGGFNGDCGIGDDGIKDINLEKLEASCNQKISNVNHMTNLKELLARNDCGIDDRGIININLEKLDADCNPRITNVNHMTNLKVLSACRNCGIDDDGIKDINFDKLCKFYPIFNHKITKKMIC